MNQMFRSITDWDKAAEWLSKCSYKKGGKLIPINKQGGKMNIVEKFKIRRAKHGDNSNNWFRNTVNKIADGFWKFGDMTGLYDQESIDLMFRDLQDFGIIQEGGNDGTSYGVVAPGVLNSTPTGARVIRTPQGMSTDRLLSIVEASKANPAFNEAERVAQLDFLRLFGNGMPLASRRGRPAKVDAFGNNVRYPESIMLKLSGQEVTPTVQPVLSQPKKPIVVKEGVTGRQIQRKKGLITSEEAKKKAASARYLEAREDRAMGIGKNGRKDFNLQRALNGKTSYANAGRPRTRASREEIVKLLRGSYENTSLGKEYYRILLSEAKRGYSTPASKAAKDDVIKRFAKSYGYHYNGI